MENIQSDSFVKLTKNATKLLIQTSYLCNFHCLHCFQGEKTKSNISFTLLDLKKLITKINENSKLESVTFLGGEPFLYKELFDIVEYTNNLGLTSVVCTNGWNITSKLQEMQNVLHHLRVSIDGDNISHDEVRQRSGSYVHALNSLKVAKELRIKTSVTYTATKIGLSGLYTMAKDVLDLGARFIKIHDFRPIGYGETNSENLILTENDRELLLKTVAEISKNLNLEVRLDDTLLPMQLQAISSVEFGSDRIEVDAEGGIYLSCKAVGDGSNAFLFNSQTSTVELLTKIKNELTAKMPQVQYAKK